MIDDLLNQDPEFYHTAIRTGLIYNFKLKGKSLNYKKQFIEKATTMYVYEEVRKNIKIKTLPLEEMTKAYFLIHSADKEERIHLINEYSSEMSSTEKSEFMNEVPFMMDMLDYLNKNMIKLETLMKKNVGIKEEMFNLEGYKGDGILH